MLVIVNMSAKIKGTLKKIIQLLEKKTVKIWMEIMPRIRSDCYDLISFRHYFSCLVLN